MTARVALRWAFVLALGAGISTCKDGTDPARPGPLSLTLATPNSDDGGVLFTISGGPIDSVRAPGFTLLQRTESGTQRRVVVAGTVNAGKIAEVWVPDTRSASQYSASVVEAASRTYAQRAVAGYSIAIAPQP